MGLDNITGGRMCHYKDKTMYYIRMRKYYTKELQTYAKIHR